MIAVIIFIALASLSDGSPGLPARMLPICQSAKPVFKVQVPCQPLSQRRRGRCGAKEGTHISFAPKIGAMEFSAQQNRAS
jgi:hypothetical protein